ncbi:unnamed protein product [Urochloa humidicola]
MKWMSAETPKFPEPSSPSADKVYKRKRNWYQEMVLDRAHINKHNGLYIVVMIDDWIINEYEYVQEFRPSGMLSNYMMHLLSRLLNEKNLNNLILEMPASLGKF